MTQTLPYSPCGPFHFDHAEETRYLYRCAPKPSKRDPASLPPTQVSHINTQPSSPWQRYQPFTYPPPAAACPASSPHYSGQGFATALSGPCPYKEVGAAAWDWGHPSLPLPTPPVQRPFREYSYKEVSSANFPVPFSQSNRSLLSTAFTIPSWGRGKVITGGEKSQK